MRPVSIESSLLLLFLYRTSFSHLLVFIAKKICAKAFLEILNVIFIFIEIFTT